MKPLLFCILCLPVLGLSANESWRFKGIVNELDADKQVVTLTHDGVRGFAEEAGEVEVSLSAGDYAIVRPGATIKGTLVQSEEGLLLEKVWPADPDAERSMMLMNRDLTRPRIGAVGKGILKVGDDFPRFAMYNQLGELIGPEGWQGKALVVNFIFTRSKVPSMSPATAERMAELQAKLEAGGMKDSVRLMSLSLDPEYDTPGVCYEFLDAREVDHSNYWMLTGSKKTLDYLTKKMGVVTAPSEKTILNHSMVVLIIDQEGKIFHRIPGTRWKLDDVYNRLEVMLGGWN